MNLGSQESSPNMMIISINLFVYYNCQAIHVATIQCASSSLEEDLAHSLLAVHVEGIQKASQMSVICMQGKRGV